MPLLSPSAAGLMAGAASLYPNFTQQKTRESGLNELALTRQLGTNIYEQYNRSRPISHPCIRHC